MITHAKKHSPVACLLAVAVSLALCAGISRGDFIAVETFEGLDLGSIDGVNGWDAAGIGGDVVTLSGEGDNQVLKLTVDTGVLRKGLVIPEGETRMLFLRFRFDGQHNYSFGMSHLASPTEYDDFGPELRRVTALDRLEIHNGLNYDVLASLTSLTWYNLWALIDNESGATKVWMHTRDGEDADAGDLLDSGGETVFDFRTFTGNDLVSFYLKAADGGSGTDPLWIDDIYMEGVDGAANLSNPVPEPNTLCLLAIAAVAGVRRRRRRSPAAETTGSGD